jgi:hypothetical protein
VPAADSADVTATNLDWNRTRAPSGPTTIGLNGTVSGTDPARVRFTLTGSACSTG